jgi:hypothetical protein
MNLCKRVLQPLLALAALAVAMTGCGGGGGVDAGGTGSTPVVASGPISGFGSVIVGGVRFDDLAAEVEDGEGTRRNRDELRLGMTVEIEAGAFNSDGSAASARRIRFDSELTGLVGGVDLVGESFLVLGQRVFVDSNTVFDDRFGRGLASLSFGQGVEVYAEFDAAAQRYRATRVEPRSALSAFVLRGPVAEVDTATRTLRIGSARYAYSGASGVPATLAPGTWVRLRLRFDPGATALWEVQRFDLALPELPDADRVRIEGLVSARPSPTRFVVGGRSVDASALSLPSTLVLGARVEVEGRWQAGVLVASRVTVRSEDEQRNRGFELNGSISAVDSAAGTLVLRGVTVSTRRPDLDLRCPSAAELRVGQLVEVRGVLAADRRTLEATRITCR